MLHVSLAWHVVGSFALLGIVIVYYKRNAEIIGRESFAERSVPDPGRVLAGSKSPEVCGLRMGRGPFLPEEAGGRCSLTFGADEVGAGTHCSGTEDAAAGILVHDCCHEAPMKRVGGGLYPEAGVRVGLSHGVEEVQKIGLLQAACPVRAACRAA